MVFYNIGCWKVKRLGNPTEFNIKLLNVIETMKMKRMSVMALAEVQWVGSGVLDVDDEVVVYPGMDVKQSGNQRGTGVILRNEFKEAWKKRCFSLYKRKVIASKSENRWFWYQTYCRISRICSYRG